MNRFALNQYSLYIHYKMTASPSDMGPIRILQILRYRSVPVGSESPAKHSSVHITYRNRLQPATPSFALLFDPVLRSISRTPFRIPLHAKPSYPPLYREWSTLRVPPIRNRLQLASKLFRKIFFAKFSAIFFAEFFGKFFTGRRTPLNTGRYRPNSRRRRNTLPPRRRIYLALRSRLRRSFRTRQPDVFPPPKGGGRL